ncbi:MAG: transposase, partial [Kiritimatiellae bacterium]|nr:transposase [Kiritimatiellia bacterium]
EEGGHKARPYAIMPDHFHALIEMPAGGKSLGDVICAFKSRVVYNYIQGVKAGIWPRFPGKIWHRNYYEMIVRDAEAEKKIAHYIRMNPWRCVMDFGNGLRGMGNPALWNAEKLGVLCSRNTPRPKSVPKADVYLSGFHSTMEKEIFTKLLELKLPVIFCPVWGLDGAMSPGVLEALEQNRMLMLEMRNRDGDLAAAEQRNRFVLEHADKLWLPHVTPGGMLDRLVRELNGKEKSL